MSGVFHAAWRGADECVVVKDEWRDHFFLPTEEYLHSLISLLNELVRIPPSLLLPKLMIAPQSRLAVNRVTFGDYEAPVRYARCVLCSAFPQRRLTLPQVR